VSAWVLWRLAKFVALVALAGGMAGALARPARAERLRIVYGTVLPAFLGIWSAGYALMRLGARGFEGWILAAMAASLLSLHLVLLVAHRPRPRAATGAMAAGALGVALAEMVLRPAGALHLGPLAVGALVGLAAGALPAPAEEGGAGEADAVALRAVRWTARIEGASLLALLAVSVGRRALQLELGGAPALLGWVHGVGVLIWLQVLVVGGRALGWSVPSMLSGLVTLLPFGTLLYERWGPMRAR
jgi:integral membrane protein